MLIWWLPGCKSMKYIKRSSTYDIGICQKVTSKHIHAISLETLLLHAHIMVTDEGPGNKLDFLCRRPVDKEA